MVANGHGGYIGVGGGRPGAKYYVSEMTVTTRVGFATPVHLGPLSTDFYKLSCMINSSYAPGIKIAKSLVQGLQ